MRARLIIEVVAGIVPGTPRDEYTRRWAWTDAQHDRLEAGDAGANREWLQMCGESREYAASLENPSRVNWVRRDWLWL